MNWFQHGKFSLASKNSWLIPAFAGITPELVYKAPMPTKLVLEPRIVSYRNLLDPYIHKNALIVCDENTVSVAGERIAAEFQTRPLILEKPKATAANALQIRDASDGVDHMIAVGSGTINDLCKYAASQLQISYAVIATAPSMNGYVSATASLVPENGRLKESLAVHPPVIVCADISVLAQAPTRLIQSGLGDSLARPTAQVDWLLSHLLLDTAYDERPFDLIKPYEPELFSSPERLLSGDIKTIEQLFRVLIASGEGMRLAGGSYPASQGEHMIAHTMEMLFGSDLPETYHGEQISVTTLTMAKIQQDMLARDTPPQLKPDTGPADFQKSKQRGVIQKRLSERWDAIRTQLQAVSLPYDTLYACAKRAGCPLQPADLGWENEPYLYALQVANTTRDRLTFLDFE